jgi:hypothetical protein
MSKENNVNYPHRGLGSYCPLSSHNFADSVAGQLVGVLEGYDGGAMNVGGYTPPYEDGCFPAGFLVITVSREGMPLVSFGIEFGRTDERGKVVREKFDAKAWVREPNNPHASGICVVNFDEAWRIVCIVGQYLETEKITLGYGC